MRVLGLLDQWPQTVGLKTTETDSVTAAEAEPRIQVSAGLHPSSGGSGGGPFLPSVPRFGAVSLQFLSWPSHGLLPLSLCPCLLFIQTPTLGFQAHPNHPGGFPLAIFNSVCRDPFPNKVTSTGSRHYMVDTSFRSHHPANRRALGQPGIPTKGEAGIVRCYI